MKHLNLLYLLNRNFKFCGQFHSAVGSSVDKQEVEKFSKIGKNWWNKNSRHGTGPLHSMNNTRVEFIRNSLNHGKILNHQLCGLQILDVGCGGGLLSESLSRLGGDITGIDPSIENIEVAKQHSLCDPSTSCIKYKQATIEQIASTGQKFDAMTCLEVIEHVENPSLFLSACCSSLNEGGSLFLSTINRTLKSYMITIVGAEYLTNILPVGTHNWYKYQTPDDIMKILSMNSMIVKDSKGMIMTPGRCGIEWKLSSDDLDVNYIIHAIKQKI